MPNGDQVQFPDDMPKEQIRSMILSKFPDAAKQAATPPDDHGLAHRQAMTSAEKAVSPITEYPRNYEEMRKEAESQIGRGASQLYEGALNSGVMGDVGKFASGLGNVGMGALGYVGSPISAAYRSVVGQPVEDVTGIPREYTEFAAQLATPGIGLPRRPGAPELPQPRIAPEPGGTGPSGAETAQAMQRLRDQGIDVNVPRSITSDNTSIQRTGQGLSHTPIVGDPLATAVHETVPGQIQQARNALAGQLGTATEANAAGRAGRFVSDAAAAEKAAAEQAALQSDSAVQAAHQKAIDDANAAIAAREAQSRQVVEAQTGAVNPQDTGAQAIDALRTAERAAIANKEALYQRAGAADAAVKGDEVSGAHAQVAKGLDADGVVLDPLLTPAASRMLADIKRLSGGEPEAAVEAPRELQAPPAARPAATAAAPEAAPQGHSLTEFLASKDGLGPDPELGAIGADRHVVDVGGVGKRRLVKQGGLTLDYAREAAEEAGYLKPGSTTNDLLDAVDAEMRGNKLYPGEVEGGPSAREAAASSERARAEQSALRRGLEGDLNKAGYGELGAEVKARTLKLMENERLDPDAAVEKAGRQLDQEDAARAESDFPGDKPHQVAAPAPREPVSVGDIEQARKRLVFLRSAASNDADRRASTNVMRQFDKWQSDAFEKALLSGDPEALNSFRKARAANTDWRERFGYNERDDVNNIVQKVLHKDVTPQEVANWLIGSGKVGKQGTTSRLYDGLMKATGNNPELAKSIQGAIWDTLSNSKNAAADIREFVHKSGRDLAEKVFPQGSRDLMLRHADTLDQGAAAREVVADVGKNTKPAAMPVDKGPMQQLAARVIGGKGDKPEALWKTIQSYTKPGGDVGALAGLVRQLPADMKGDIAGAVVRGLGQNQSGQFSLDLFARDWGKMTPQSKAVLFGNAGEHLKALDDLATIGQRLKDVKGKYGNPSGTAQTSAFHHLAAVMAGILGGHFSLGATGTAIGGAIGGNIGARVLASPAGASSIAKYAKALERQAASPTPASQALVSMTQRNLANTVKALGATRAPSTPIGGLRQLQGPVPAGAQGEQR